MQKLWSSCLYPDSLNLLCYLRLGPTAHAIINKCLPGLQWLRYQDRTVEETGGYERWPVNIFRDINLPTGLRNFDIYVHYIHLTWNRPWVTF